ncbi:MFS transporter [Caldivirga maquilingensis]|uniref:Major facilitator superfamily MFS_1 n=1 Tax=Caldivirga maquilingensis (strain ATCC 700844 / DSM 13496 / JCM 10307 / IC-167) TaxID=397948 RepID=A8MCT9_CALMQ|nr:MFS transporter [Caldivirga maquilingensis]ABW01595.1 major facilitator superfamily MFS_1 [Caldivirga maquilingensis IC-167]
MSNLREIDYGPLGRSRFFAITSTALGMFLWGFILALAPLTTQWPFVPSSFDEYVLLAAPVSLMVGNLIIGKLSDALGRKMGFIMTMVIYGVGALLIILSSNVYELIAGIALAEFGLGGEEPATLAYMAEMMPIRLRERIIIGVTNVANIGAAVAAALSLVASSMYLQKLFFGVTILVTIIIILATRLLIPESYRWSNVKSSCRVIGLSEMKGFRIRLIFLTLIALTIVLTYALLALVMGPYLFPKLTSWIVLLYNVGESVGGLIGMALADIMGMRKFTLMAYLGGFITMLLVIPQLAFAPQNLPLFLLILSVNGVFGELGWAARVVLEPELFPTGSRSMGVALVRAIAYVAYIASIFITAGFTIWQYAWYNVALWSLGLLGALIWFTHGVETRLKTLEEVNPQ